MVNIVDGLDVGDKLDSDGHLEVEAWNYGSDSGATKWLKREDAIKLAKHLIELFRLDVKEV